VLLDADDEPSNDRLIDVYALRAARGYLHALRAER
jgi:hypothetical protein